MNRTARKAAIALVALAAAAGIALSAYNIGHARGANTAQAASVSTYNDGFADGKADSCQQGDATACAWLQNPSHPDYTACLTYVDAHALASDICEPLAPGACAYYTEHHYAAPDFCTKQQ